MTKAECERALPFFWGQEVFLAEATPRSIIGLLVHEANYLKTIDYDQIAVGLALLLLSMFCIENPSIGSWSMVAMNGPFEGTQKVLAMG